MSAERQNVLSVSVLAAERALAQLEGRPAGGLGPRSARALESAPLAARWAVSFTRGVDVSVEEFRRFGAPNTVRVAIPGIAEACVSDPDERLRVLLIAAIDDCAAVCGRGREPSVDPLDRAVN